MEQENDGGISRPRLSIEDRESIHLYCAIKNVRAHILFTSRLSGLRACGHLEYHVAVPALDQHALAPSGRK
jgi:hypothetical protein